MTSIRVYVGDTRVLASPSPSLFFTPVLYFSDQDVEPRAKKKRQENNNSIDQVDPQLSKTTCFQKKNSCLSNINPIYSICTSLFYKIKGGIFFIPLIPGALYTGRLRPEDQPLTVLYTIFATKDTRFVYLLSLLTHSNPFTYFLQLMVNGVTIQ